MKKKKGPDWFVPPFRYASKLHSIKYSSMTRRHGSKSPFLNERIERMCGNRPRESSSKPNQLYNVTVQLYSADWTCLPGTYVSGYPLRI